MENDYSEEEIEYEELDEIEIATMPMLEDCRRNIDQLKRKLFECELWTSQWAQRLNRRNSELSNLEYSFPTLEKRKMINDYLDENMEKLYNTVNELDLTANQFPFEDVLKYHTLLSENERKDKILRNKTDIEKFEEALRTTKQLPKVKEYNEKCLIIEEKQICLTEAHKEIQIEEKILIGDQTNVENTTKNIILEVVFAQNEIKMINDKNSQILSELQEIHDETEVVQIETDECLIKIDEINKAIEKTQEHEELMRAMTPRKIKRMELPFLRMFDFSEEEQRDGSQNEFVRPYPIIVQTQDQQTNSKMINSEKSLIDIKSKDFLSQQNIRKINTQNKSSNIILGRKFDLEIQPKSRIIETALQDIETKNEEIKKKKPVEQSSDINDVLISPHPSNNYDNNSNMKQDVDASQLNLQINFQSSNTELKSFQSNDNSDEQNNRKVHVLQDIVIRSEPLNIQTKSAQGPSIKRKSLLTSPIMNIKKSKPQTTANKPRLVKNCNTTFISETFHPPSSPVRSSPRFPLKSQSNRAIQKNKIKNTTAKKVVEPVEQSKVIPTIKDSSDVDLNETSNNKEEMYSLAKDFVGTPDLNDYEDNESLLSVMMFSDDDNGNDDDSEMSMNNEKSSFIGFGSSDTTEAFDFFGNNNVDASKKQPMSFF